MSNNENTESTDHPENHADEHTDDQSGGQVSEVGNLDPADADTPIADGDATSGYPEGESGEVQEPEESGPNANPHRNQETGRGPL